MVTSGYTDPAYLAVYVDLAGLWAETSNAFWFIDLIISTSGTARQAVAQGHLAIRSNFQVPAHKVFSSSIQNSRDRKRSEPSQSTSFADSLQEETFSEPDCSWSNCVRSQIYAAE